MNRKVLLLVNPFSGSKKGLVYSEKVKKFLDAEAHKYVEVISQNIGFFAGWISQNSLSEFQLIVIIGGDGTMNEIINAIFKNRITDYPPLYLLPAGSGNALNHDLENLDLEKALLKIKNPKIEFIDLLEIKSAKGIHYAFNAIGWGMVATINQTSDKLRWLGGARYAVAAIWHILKNPVYFARLSFENVRAEQGLTFVMIMNTIHTGKSMKMAPHADLKDGLLDILIVKKQPFYKFLSLFPSIFTGKHIDTPYVQYFHTDRISISSPNTFLVVDGEQYDPGNFEVLIHKQKIKILMP
ncbi:MAG: diacylglycerol kinase family lipid kinase [Bacteroidetes bacterium]|nr:diacylglycerol kinase family lipid kinase [Bacteroidota bacterium]